MFQFVYPNYIIVSVFFIFLYNSLILNFWKIRGYLKKFCKIKKDKKSNYMDFPGLKNKNIYHFRKTNIEMKSPH